ncbi:microfibrillar-associated protein 1-like [Panicum miliaceum]|uniref:Microfibrillar-associated protein 1-like n=1 Tax=Panicum miliaceum TaxID=4540 RepID=A0A3L6RSP0_PANMI|nr:microfibrillar-associated protein 1-like [Panicum miliaceum]
MSVAAGVSDAAIAVRDKLHGKIGQTKVKRLSIVEEQNERQEADIDEEDEEAQEERRRRIRERQLLREQEELLPQEDEEPVEDEESEESEYETDFEDEQMGMAMVKPVFIPKSQRDTIAERERLEEEERQLEELVKKRLEARKIETRQIVVEEIKKEEHIEKALNEEANIEDVDTDDELNEAEEYESWKNREIARIKRDREERDARLKEKEEIEKVRNMIEEERREWERKNPKLLRQTKQKWKFMQKYYHKGAFFQESADDVIQSAGKEDTPMDKSILPKVMQVKHFGRSGRTKWTHLVNEDTTDWNAPWATNGPLRAKYNAKMAGMNAPIAKPKGSKKLKDWDAK